MHELLAQAYGTKEKIASMQAAPAQADGFDAVDVALLEELEKTAHANGIDLNELSNDDIAEILSASKAQLGVDGAQDGAQVGDEDLQVKMAEADLLGRQMAHSYFSEMTDINAAAQGNAIAFDKQASAEDMQVFEELATNRANAILSGLNGDGDTFVKEASLDIGDEELDALISQRAAELLDAAGYDVDAISQALENAL